MVRRIGFLPFEGSAFTTQRIECSESGLNQLHRHRRRFAAADAEARDAALAAPRSCSAAISVVVMRAPLAPIGWPSAVAPPLTLIFSCGMPRSRIGDHGDAGERLVDLEQVDVVDAPAGLLEHLAGSRAPGPR